MEVDFCLWDEAENNEDLESALVQYCAASDGTRDYVDKIFNEIREKYEKVVSDTVFETYLNELKFKHLDRLNTYFGYRLRLSLAPTGEAREKLRTTLIEADLLNPNQS